MLKNVYYGREVIGKRDIEVIPITIIAPRITNVIVSIPQGPNTMGSGKYETYTYYEYRCKIDGKMSILIANSILHQELIHFFEKTNVDKTSITRIRISNKKYLKSIRAGIGVKRYDITITN
jgi:hypothetical protein